jgi:hypothetical protein
MTIQWLARTLGLCATCTFVIFLNACQCGNTNITATPVNFILLIPSNGFGNTFATTTQPTPASALIPQSYGVSPLISNTVIV